MDLDIENQSQQLSSAPVKTKLAINARVCHGAFGLGTEERHIPTVDANGVALPAIPGLNSKRIGEPLSALESLLQK